MVNHQSDYPLTGRSLAEVANKALDESAANDESDRFVLETTTDQFDMPVESLTYFTNLARVAIWRPTLDTRELSELDSDPHSKTASITVNIHATRPFTLYLASGELYHAIGKFVGIGLFDEGAYLERLVTAFVRRPDESGEATSVLGSTGLSYLPLSPQSDSFLQGLIDPTHAITPPANGILG